MAILKWIWSWVSDNGWSERKKRRDGKKKDMMYQTHMKEANDRFNIRTINGYDVIVYCGVIVSRVGDTDLLERLQEYRKQYVEN